MLVMKIAINPISFKKNDGMLFDNFHSSLFSFSVLGSMLIYIIFF